MDLALVYDPQLQAFDLAIRDGDLLGDDTLASAVLASLMADRLVEAYEVKPREDRRGWWGDAFAQIAGDKTGSRLWLLEREKQLAGVVQDCKHYCEEALQWAIDDGIATAVTATVFVPRSGWLVAMIRFELNGASRTFRFEFDQARQVWHLQGESF